MKSKTSVTLDRDVLRALDRLVTAKMNRSKLIEKAILALLADHKRRERDAKDLAILDQKFAPMNREMATILEFQEVP